MNRFTSHQRPQGQGRVQQRGSKPDSPWGIHSFIRNLSLVATGSFALIAIFLLAGVWRSGTSFFSDLYTLFDKPQPEPKIDLRAIVVQQVRNASELTTAVYAMETVVPTSRDRTVGGYVVGTTTLLYIAYGEVRAGIDLSAVQPTDVQVNGDAITLRLPSPKILDSKIDVNRSKVYDYDRGFMGLGPDVAPELQELAQRQTLERMVESACTSGILQQANDRAKIAITQLLGTTYKSLSVEEQPLPPACGANTLTPSLLPPSSPEQPTLEPLILPSSSPPSLSSPSLSPPANENSLRENSLPQPPF
ncbi:MAG: DUF4230 domain-containing protein [Oscillatoriophycideae cyanobacterium NC_groundwater_1537_Pr4_S-0.65um_50_18]|nr:DUF4230 domain-containing protein [Oscillatoriophycideae cyanobacterium NC_groundwater_1537_Pr4_S-0.65um_50_18]